MESLHLSRRSRPRGARQPVARAVQPSRAPRALIASHAESPARAVCAGRTRHGWHRPTAPGSRGGPPTGGEWELTPWGGTWEAREGWLGAVHATPPRRASSDRSYSNCAPPRITTATPPPPPPPHPASAFSTASVGGIGPSARVRGRATRSARPSVRRGHEARARRVEARRVDQHVEVEEAHGLNLKLVEV